jgi:hypothetical protein
MKIIRQAIIGDYKFIVAPDYLAIETEKDAVVTLETKDAGDIVLWLYNEYFSQGCIKADQKAPGMPLNGSRMPQEVRKPESKGLVADPRYKGASSQSSAVPALEVDYSGRRASGHFKNAVLSGEMMPKADLSGAPVSNGTGQKVFSESGEDLAAVARGAGVVIEQKGPDFPNV